LLERGGWCCCLCSSVNSHLAPFSTIPKKPGFSTKNQGFQVATIARNPVFGAGARSELIKVLKTLVSSKRKPLALLPGVPL
jgi:hypothetical protein